MFENLLNELLAKLNMKANNAIFVSVTPNVGLEMLQVDSVTKTVQNYGYRPLEYNEGMREIANYEDFKNKLQELFTELNINPKCNVILNFPTVYFGSVTLPVFLSEEGINEVITSEAEQSYIFKKCEPSISWFKSVVEDPKGETKTVLYSAMQKPAISKIKEVFAELGSTLLGIEPAILNTLKALYSANLMQFNVEEKTAWNLLLITSTGYSLVKMSGRYIVDYYEEPLALKTYDISEIYNIINSSVRVSLVNFPSQNLYIISETDLISAEHVANTIQVDDTNVFWFENNMFRKNEFLQVSLNVLQELVPKISLEIVGESISTFSKDYPISLNFLGGSGLSLQGESYTFTFKDKTITITELLFKKVLVAMTIVLIVPTLLLMMIVPAMKNNVQTKSDNLQQELTLVDSQLEVFTGNGKANNFVLKDEIEKVVKNNRNKLITYMALGESVPAKLWLTDFIVKEDGKVDIKGACENVEDVYVFFRNMKMSLINSQIRLHKLEMQASSIDDAISSGKSNYQFEITNMSDAELMPQTEETSENDKSKKDSKKERTDNQQQNRPSETKSVKQLEPVEIGN